MKLNKYIYAILFMLAFAFAVNCQAIHKISSPCPRPSLFYSSVFNKADGNIYYDPCVGGSSIFSGIVDFSGATVILPGGGGPVRGSGTLNHIPRFTASTVLGDTPFTWNGSQYIFSNTAGTAQFGLFLQPSDATGLLSMGDCFTTPTQCISISQGGGSVTINSGTGVTNIGDTANIGNSTAITLNDTANSITLNGNPIFSSANANSAVYLNGTKSLGSVALTNGQLLVGSTGTFPQAATLTAGTGVAITNGAGTITVSTSGVAIPNSTFLASNYTNATATFSNTALSLTLTAAKTYGFGCSIFASNSTAADGFQIDFNGGSATATTFIAGSNSTLVTGTTSTLAGTFSNATLTGTNMITINGTIVVNAGGTFTLRGAEVAHTVGTLTFLTGSRCVATQLN